MRTLRPPRRWAGAVGVGHALLVLAAHAWLGFSTAVFATRANTAVIVWTLGGAVLLGATVGIAVARDGVLAPPLLVAAAFALAVAGTLPYREALRSPSPAGGIFPYSVYELGWPVLLGLVALAWAAERWVSAYRGPRDAAPE